MMEQIKVNKLRLNSAVFFVSASLQDMFRSKKKRQDIIEHFPDYYQVQLNDTHPAVAVAEMMRLVG